MPNGINPDEVNKAGRFIKYLQELTNLRTPTVRHVRTYEEKGKVLWLSDCPHEQGVFTQAWGRDEEHDQDEWLEVQRRQEPPLPAVPDECKDWVNHKTLRDTNDLPEKPELPNVPGQCEDWVSHKALRDTNDLPELLPEITRQIPNPNWYEDSDQPETITQTERLEDHPEVGQEWDRYVGDQWLSWMERHNAWERDHKPKLLSEIIRQTPNPNWREGSDQPETIPKTERLEDYPEVKQAWDRYIQDKWLPWTKEHAAWKRVHRVYSTLFAIYQMQLRLGEEYELVLGLGLLTWQTPTEPRVRRHLIVADAFLEFEAHLGKFIVRPHAEGAKLRPELDMLEINEQLSDAEKNASNALSQAEDNPWERGCVESVLNALVHSINPQGEYSNTLKANVAFAPEQPIVEYAPALILRERSTKGLIKTLERIKEQIESGERIPCGFAELAEIHPRDNSYLGDEPGDANAAFDNDIFDGEIFFPLSSNEEQRRIVEKIQEAKGVLVQGPPGTGKSHTIANLICHLLATGKRILITAKTSHALQVLYKKHLPTELRPLCINLLGSGREGHNALETSVRGILHKAENWIEEHADQDRMDNEDRLNTLRKKKAEIDQRIRAIRESETRSQSIAERTYRGTAARIAETVGRDRAKYNWFTDDVRWNEDWPRNISTNHLQRVLAELRRFTPEMRKELKLAWPQTLPSTQLFADLVQNEASAIKEEQSVKDGADKRLVDLLVTNNPSVIKAIRNTFSSLRSARERLSASSFSWMNNAVHAVLGGNLRRWHERLRVTRNVIDSVEELVATVDKTPIEFPDTCNIILLRNDARTLQQHMEDGKKLGWLGWRLFRFKTLRDCRYIIKNVKINGHPCSTVEHFTNLADVLDVRIECEKAWDFWEGLSERIEGPYVLQLAELKSLRDALGDALQLEKRIDECREAINQCAGINEPTYSDESQIEKIILSCRLALVGIDKQRAGEEINRLENAISRVGTEEDVHPVTNDLLNAIRGRKTDEFTRYAEKIQNLEEQYHNLEEMNKSLSQLRSKLPRFTDSMEETYNEHHWKERIEHISDAWRWRQAQHWIEYYINKEDFSSLNTRAKQIRKNINDTIARLSSLYAWSFCVKRFNDNHLARAHMEAWQQAMRRLGQGTGRHAHRHRLDAQEHLDGCREEVPAWVMQLDLVWDTVKIAPGKFDVIIVDEASQCGIKALPLFYLAKKIVIVGDDKQISPEVPGLDHDLVHSCMKRYLYDFDFGDTFHIKSSLFDHGRRFYGHQQITLREHFRCMPEIIRFSNDLCYSDTPLIPLRQHGSDRLPPLEHVFLSGGYSKRTGQQTTNPPEIEAVVEKIAEMCNDSRYDGKTMGVIALQGIEQAKLIESQLLKRLGAEVMEERRLVCGNPYHFQGDERDIILLSLVVATGENGVGFNALTKEEDKKRFNVAASRARDQMILFHSVTCDDLSPIDLRRKLLEFFENRQPQQIAGTDISLDELELRTYQGNRQIVKPPKPFESWFEVDVALELLHGQFRVIPQYEVAGYRIDLVVEGGEKQLAVECDGDYWHGPDRYDADMQRQRQLERCGWQFFRIRESKFRLDKENTLAELWQALETRGIFPHYVAAEPHEDASERDGLNDCEDANENENEDCSSADSENEGSQPGHPIDAITEEKIKDAIISALSRQPNQWHPLQLQDMTRLVLREVGVQTRGRRRLAFGEKIMRIIDTLEKNGRIEKHINNREIRLINSMTPSG